MKPSSLRYIMVANLNMSGFTVYLQATWYDSLYLMRYIGEGGVKEVEDRK